MKKHELVGMSRQDFFDLAWKHFIVESQPASYSQSDVFRYRLSGQGCDTIRCAVGLIIPDDLYHRGMEGQTASDVVPMSIGEELGSRFLNDAQRQLHDTLIETERDLWTKYYRRFAARWDLTIPGEESPETKKEEET